MRRSARSSQPRIGYAPYSPDFRHPGDRRRFVAYAKARNLCFELARPEERYDIVVLSEFADISAWPDYRHGKIIFDSIDSYLAIPRKDVKQMLRGIVWYASGRHRRLNLDFRAAIERMCRRADAVVCTTDDQKRHIEPLCDNVHVILDIHDTVARKVKSDYRAGRPFRLVWEGLPSNVPCLKSIASVLGELSQRDEIVLHLVTDPDRPRFLGRFGTIDTLEVARRICRNVVFHRWEEATCSDIITQCDLAIIPIPLDDVFASGKPANKLALLWRLAMPVVTSATQAYSEMQNAAGLGYLACKDEADWLVALRRLMNDEAERREAGLRGAAFANSSIQTNELLRRWDDVLRSIGFDISDNAASGQTSLARNALGAAS